MKKLLAFEALTEMFSGRFPGQKQKTETSAMRRTSNTNWRKHYVAPRSMTEAEKEYYAIHKNLHGFTA